MFTNSIRYDEEEVNAPAPASYDHSVDEREHTVDQWKALIYQEVCEYEQRHNTLGASCSAGLERQASQGSQGCPQAATIVSSSGAVVNTSSQQTTTAANIVTLPSTTSAVTGENDVSLRRPMDNCVPSHSLTLTTIVFLSYMPLKISNDFHWIQLFNFKN